MHQKELWQYVENPRRRKWQRYSTMGDISVTIEMLPRPDTDDPQQGIERKQGTRIRSPLSRTRRLSLPRDYQQYSEIDRKVSEQSDITQAQSRSKSARSDWEFRKAVTPLVSLPAVGVLPFA